MTSEFIDFTARLREFIRSAELGIQDPDPESKSEPPCVGCYETAFNKLALDLFRLQFVHNAPYRRLCEARSVLPGVPRDWREIPAVPTAAFKELVFSCLPAAERATVFHSSGTTEQWPSRHFHNAESLAIYEASLWRWFRTHVAPDLESQITDFKLAL